MGRPANGVFTAADTANSWLGRIGTGLLAPLRLPVRLLVRSLAWIGKPPASKWIGGLLGLLAYPFIAPYGFFSAFHATRSRELLWWGIPIASVIILAAGSMYGLSIGNRRALPERYQAAFENAISSQDFSQAELYRQKLQQLDQPFERSSLNAADKLFAAGQIEQAFATAQKIAPLESPGSAAGHFWLVQHLLGAKLPTELDSALALQSARKHLDHLRTLQFGELPVVVIQEALIELREKNVSAALDALKRVHETSVDASAMRLKLLLKFGHKDELVEESKVFLKTVRGLPKIAEKASQEIFSLWCYALILAGGDRLQRGTVLSAWHQRFPDDDEAVLRLAAWRMEELDAVGTGTPKSEVERLVLMMDEVSRMLGAERRELLSKRLNWMRAQTAAIPVFAEVLEGLQRVESPDSIVLEFFGTQAAIGNDFETAERLLQKATVVNPDDYVAWNNLAFVIAKYDPAAGLPAADRALAIKPDNVEALRTRGIILLKLEQWQKRQTTSKSP